MKIVVPHTPTGLAAETVEALHAHAAGHDIHYVDVSDHDEQLYELWLALWAACEDVVVVEHDIEIHAGVLEGFAACPNPWCSFGYRYAHFGVYHGTGCVRIRSTLMTATPNLIKNVSLHQNQQHPPRHWCSLDAFMQHELGERGFEQCRHEPPVTHHGVGVSHGCVAAPVTV